LRGNDTGCGVAYKLVHQYLKVENGQSKCCTLSPAAATVNNRSGPVIVVGTTVYGTTLVRGLDPVSLTREAMAAAPCFRSRSHNQPFWPHITTTQNGPASPSGRFKNKYQRWLPRLIHSPPHLGMTSNLFHPSYWQYLGVVSQNLVTSAHRACLETT